MTAPVPYGDSDSSDTEIIVLSGPGDNPPRQPTAKELEQAIGRHAGNRKVGKVVWQHDPAIQSICNGWPQGIDSARSRRLGFETDKDLDEVVRAFIADDLDEQMKIVKPAG